MTTKRKPPEINIKNLAKIKFGYNCEIVLPLENAIILMEQLENAESIDTGDYNNPKVINYKEDINMQIISEYDYKNLKANTLLNPEENPE